MSPRDRLLTFGESSLSDAELLSLLMGPAVPRETVRSLMEEISGHLPSLSWTDGHRLGKIRGIGASRAAVLSAAVELGRRIAFSSMSRVDMLDCPDNVARYIFVKHYRPDQEVMGALYLDARNYLVHAEEIFVGTRNCINVEPAPILKIALLNHAAALILFHTHPGGSSEPSPEDRTFTSRIKDACELMGIRLLDHLIVGTNGDWTSMKRRNLLSANPVARRPSGRS